MNEDKKNKILKILLWIVIFPIMLIVKGIIAFVKTPKIKDNTKIIIGVVVLIVIVIGYTDEKIKSEEISSNDSHLSQDISDDLSEKAQNEEDGAEQEELFSDVLEDERLRADFLSACEQVGIESKKIKNLKQISDWAAGTQYTFTYKNNDFVLHCNMDSTVQTIMLGLDVALYQRGYEPYKLEDYVVDLSMASRLQTWAKDLVKAQLNYPSTADFPFLDWNYARERNIYTVGSYVTAANAFNVKSDVRFTIMYQIEGNVATPVYFKMGNEILVDKRASISVPERKEIEVVDEVVVSDDSGILLIDGKKGKYGKIITLDGEDYIDYHIPVGTYVVRNEVNYCKVYLASDVYKKNPDGYMENDVIEILEFTSNGEEKTITVKTGQHIELTLNASVLFVLVE